MTSKDDEFYQRLLSTFRGEAAEHLQAIADGVLTLEKGTSTSEQTALIETIYREAHSLKGAARAVNLKEIETLCQPLESLLAAWQKLNSPPPAEQFDLIHQSVTVLEDLVAQPANGVPAALSARARELGKLLALALTAEPGEVRASQTQPKSTSLPVQPPQAPQAQAAAPRPPKTASGPTPMPAVSPSHKAIGPCLCRPEKPAITETIRVATSKLDGLLLQAEEFIAAKLIAGQRVVDLREAVAEFDLWQKYWAKVQPLRRDLKRWVGGNGSRQLSEQFGRTADQLEEFLAWNAELVKNLEHKLYLILRAAEQDSRVISGLVDNLLVDVKKVLMLPFAMMLETFPKLVRDLAREQGKEVDFTIHGREVEIDRRILQEIKDPLLHLVRNSIDHGLETPEERTRRGKPAPGRLSITIAQRDSGKVEICVADDGVGINTEKVKAAAVKQGLMSAAEAEALTAEEARQLIFRSGISTAPIITTISGRGLGLAIVQEKVEKLGGSLQVEAGPMGGTIFRLILPLTLATFRGTLIQVSQRLFVVPTTYLERVARVKTAEVKTVENRETILLNGQPLALVSLAAILGLPPPEPDRQQHGFLTVLVLNASGRRLGFSVDGVLNEQEVLVKNLGSQLQRVPNIAGATVLGSGAVVPILNVIDLVNSAINQTSSLRPVGQGKKEAEPQAKSILVAEDSITARTLLKNILELAGYRVQTAVDGLEGFTALQKGHFDLVVSDVEMPRLNGFELTSRIRADKRLAELPVILVTALESPEDRKRGIEVGANAYLVKSSFDQGNLLDLIQQFI
ncbi:MAG: hybrid sensor histidine kinase/response regulator [Desulfobacca sp.]|uniref:hybrid sensor histidine kinase/response regulator n=1 Tax=Desulfobacca sp. TaxID=2067990 RepID=UPI0040490502